MSQGGIMKNDRVVTASLVIIVIFICGVVLRLAKPVLFPFFLAILISFVLYPLLDLMTKRRIPKFVAVLFILIVAFFIIYLLGSVFYSSGKTFASEFPEYGKRLNSILKSIQTSLNISAVNWESIDWTKQFDMSKIGGLLFSSLGPFFSFIANLFLVFVFLVFIMAGRGQTKTKILNSFKENESSKIIEVIRNIDNQIQRYLVIKTIVSLITGLFVTIVLMLFGLDFAIVFGFLTFLLNYIPNIGSIIATIFPPLIAVVQFESLWPAFWILIILASIQTAMGNFIEPRLMGEGLGLSPLVYLFFLFFWGWLWGIPGMILAVPIAAIIKIVCSNIPSLKFLAILMSKGAKG